MTGPFQVLTWSCSQATQASGTPAPVPSPARRHPVTTPERAQVRVPSEGRARREPKVPKEVPEAGLMFRNFDPVAYYNKETLLLYTHVMVA